MNLPLGQIASRGLILLAAMLYFGFAIIVIALRYWVLPGIESYRADIEQAASFGLGRRVTIEGVEAEWHGLNPYLALHKVAIYDEAGRPALEFGLVKSTLSWSSLWHLQLRQRSLEVWSPNLTVRRDHGGRIFVAGIPLAKSDASDGRAADWILGQQQIAIRDAAVTWIDEQRAAPPLALAHVEFLLDNSGDRHRFALRAQPPREDASALDLRGDLYGEAAGNLPQWRGQLYANLDYADLAVWRTWLDYPMDLSRGRGGLRMWAEFKAEQLTALTADVGLADVVTRLGADLPVLELQHLQGRFQMRYAETGYAVAGTGVNFRTVAGIVMEPADFSVSVARAPAAPGGEVKANGVDLHGLAQLADYLPLEAGLRGALDRYAPQGKVYDLKYSWEGPPEKPLKYAVQSRFTGLGVNAGDVTPGFSGLSGNIKADEKSGALTLDSHTAMVALPAVFEDPQVALDELGTDLKWRLTDGGLALDIARLTFANADAAGSASGSYHSQAGGPRLIDLNGRLTRADAKQVARYLPKRIHDNVRNWVSRAVLAGSSQDVRLRLKGDLTHFPFADDQDGIFQIVAKVQGGRLEYATAWPEIDNIVGDLTFHNRHMEVNATQGTILGAKVGRTHVDIPDLANPAERSLNIAGSADGPTSEFLRFIDASPVAGLIDNFTHDMRAAGNGKLTLKINLPLPTLEHPVPVNKPKIAGSYQFIANQVLAEPSLPPFSQLNGRIEFTEGGVSARNLNANFLGGPAVVNVNTRPETGITVLAQGSANMDALGRALDYRWLKKLSGVTPWRASIAVRHKAVDIAFDSTLAGVASELPEPLRKAAAEAMPLRIERHVVPLEGTIARDGATRSETWLMNLGKAVAAQWMSRSGGPAGSELQRASLAFNEVAQMPPRGLLVSGRLPVLDVDQWRELELGDGESKRSDGVRLNLKLGALDVLGRRLNDVDFRSSLAEGNWHSSIQSKEMEGDIDWQPKGQGRVVGRLKQFTLPEASPRAQLLAQAQRSAGAADDRRAGDLPELDLTADSFVAHERNLGRLELTASNVGRDWNIEKLVLMSPDGSLRADGVWQNYAVQSRTSLNLHLESGDIGKLLDRLGFPGSMRRGKATLDGKLAWLGSPQSIDYPSLSGNFKVDAEQGQFSKIEPGIGKLLGILSLQALPRRLSLDFKDVFSDGFAFDKLTASADITRGVMTTNDFRIDGPAAKVQITGSTNIVAETQNLHVKVLPTVSEGVSLLTGLVNPIYGIGSLVIQKVFKVDPLAQILAREYSVTGSWDDPKVVKVHGPQTEATAEPGAAAVPAAQPAASAASSINSNTAPTAPAAASQGARP
jgi:uncharacterized protein (TIGR02099 family)